MVHEQLLLAADFILERRFNDARHLLQTIDDPRAKEWLGKLDVFQAQVAGGASATLGILTVESASAGGQFHAPAQTAQPVSAGAFVPPTLFGTPPASAYRQRIRKPLNALSLPLALIGGSVGATIGAMVWALAAYVTGSEFGVGAMILGGLAGAGAVFLSGSRHGPVIQLAALVNAFGGILLGRYLSLYLLMLSGSSDLGLALEATPPFADKTSEALFGALTANVAAIDVLFVVIAVYAAWRIAQ